jgi:hypothetical protein
MLQRLAGSEEIVPVPDVTRDCSSKITIEMMNSVKTSLSKVCCWSSFFFLCCDSPSSNDFYSMSSIWIVASSLRASINLFHILLAASLPPH